MADLPQEAIDWMRSRPAIVQQTMRRFPPGAVVRGLVRMLVPAPGETAVVVSYFEDGNVGVQGMVRREDYDHARAVARSEFSRDAVFTAACQPENIEVVEYGEITPGDVEAALGSEDAA